MNLATACFLLFFAVATQGHAAGFLDRLFSKDKPDTKKPPADTNSAPALSASPAVNLSHDEISDGLKAALARGIQEAVAALGKEDGFLKDATVKIPLPSSLARVESSLRVIREDRLADQFILTMNRAA